MSSSSSRIPCVSGLWARKRQGGHYSHSVTDRNARGRQKSQSGSISTQRTRAAEPGYSSNTRLMSRFSSRHSANAKPFLGGKPCRIYLVHWVSENLNPACVFTVGQPSLSLVPNKSTVCRAFAYRSVFSSGMKS